MSPVAILIGIFLASLGLVARFTSLAETRRNSRYRSAAVWFRLFSVEVVIVLDGVIL
jgi:hypothetical protein